MNRKTALSAVRLAGMIFVLLGLLGRFGVSPAWGVTDGECPRIDVYEPYDRDVVAQGAAWSPPAPPGATS